MDFQTPTWLCNYMTSILVNNPKTVLEPTPGEGNLVKSLERVGIKPIAPLDFFTTTKVRYDAIVMNPPHTPMKLGYEILSLCMERSDQIIALMPWLALINSTKRTKMYTDFGIKSIVHLPRTVFPGARIQTCIIHLMKGFREPTIIVFL